MMFGVGDRPSDLKLVLNISGMMEDSENFNADIGSPIEHNVGLNRKASHGFSEVVSFMPPVWELGQHREFIQNLSHHEIGGQIIFLGEVSPNIL
jgi:hypothetical protein